MSEDYEVAVVNYLTVRLNCLGEKVRVLKALYHCYEFPKVDAVFFAVTRDAVLARYRYPSFVPPTQTPHAENVKRKCRPECNCSQRRASHGD